MTLDEDFTQEEFQEEFGVAASFPRVTIDGEIIGSTPFKVRMLPKAVEVLV